MRSAMDNGYPHGLGHYPGKGGKHPPLSLVDRLREIAVALLRFCGFSSGSSGNASLLGPLCIPLELGSVHTATVVNWRIP